MATHREEARRKTRAWQVAAVVLLAAAGGVIALPVAKLLGPPEHRPRVRAAANDGTRAPALPPVDPLALGRVLSNGHIGGTVAVRPPVVDPPPPPAGTTVAAVEPPKRTAPTELAFIGTAGRADRQRAIVRLGDQQMLLSAGDERDGIKLVSIGEGFVTIEQNGASKRVDRAQTVSMWPTEPLRRGGVAVARPVPVQPNPAQPQVSVASNGPNGGRRGARSQSEFDRQQRYRAAMGEPDRPDLASMDPEKADYYRREVIGRELMDPAIGGERRRELLRMAGVPENVDVDQQIEALQNMGVDISDPEQLMHLLKSE